MFAIWSSLKSEQKVSVENVYCELEGVKNKNGREENFKQIKDLFMDEEGQFKKFTSETDLVKALIKSYSHTSCYRGINGAIAKSEHDKIIAYLSSIISAFPNVD